MLKNINIKIEFEFGRYSLYIDDEFYSTGETIHDIKYEIFDYIQNQL